MTSRGQARLQAAAAGALLLFALFVFWQATLLKVGTPTRPGPGLFPLGLSAALAILAIGLILEARAARGETASPPGRSLAAYRVSLSALGLVLVFALTMEPLGFLPSAALLTCALLRLAGRGWRSSLTIGILATLSAYVLFDSGLSVPLPRGILDGLF